MHGSRLIAGCFRFILVLVEPSLHVQRLGSRLIAGCFRFILVLVEPSLYVQRLGSRLVAEIGVTPDSPE